ncbi:hypothetical protein C8035_v003727 [Colletotrichum spinosum]|uniref:EthD domain-containing protein n=1 Tax=Colletotrichum spinosum TaxID=1347390 RepID=A0A4R8PVU0_9PEZI|nr:hypothetical protein C8035_v003727 [Colletotrichum spinosum]
MVRFSVISYALAFVGLLASVCADCADNDSTQMITYVKRHPSLKQADFWNYWYTEHAPKVAPLANYFNISEYSQIQVGGYVLPTAAGATKPASDIPVAFDGIANFRYRRPDDLTAMLEHPYYRDIVGPDETVFIDKKAFGGGQVATFVGIFWGVVSNNNVVW